MNISENKYATSNDCTFVRYSIETEYSLCRDYTVVDRDTVLDDPGRVKRNDKAYSYGILTNIYNTNLFVLDIDNLHNNLFYDFKHGDKFINAFVNKYNAIHFKDKGFNKIEAIVDLYIEMIGAPLINAYVFKSSTSNGLHLYFELDNNYDVSGLYKHNLTRLIACNGYLQFVINSGYSNIRVTNKIKTNEVASSNIQLLNRNGHPVRS